MASDIVAVKEKVSGSNDSRVVPYFVVENDPTLTLSISAAVTAAAAQGLIDQGTAADSYTHQQISSRIFRVTLNYGSTKTKRRTPPPPGEEHLDFGLQFQAKSKMAYRALEWIGTYKAGTDTAATGAGQTTLVNVERTGNVSHVAGLQVQPLPETFYLEYVVPNALATSSYRNLIEGMAGCFCDGAFLDYDAGEVQLVNFSARPRTDEDWMFRFGFGAELKRTLTYSGATGDIVVTDVPPTCIDWARYVELKTEYATDEFIVEKKAVLVIVQRVWETADFDLLELPLTP